MLASRVIASKENWIESLAVEQLEKTAQLPGMLEAVGMPDLHPGKDAPIGAVFASEKLFYPHLVGNDIGCGMALWQTNLEKRKSKLDKWTKKLVGLDVSWEGDCVAFRMENDILNGEFDSSLGTIGGGNHFAELQQVHEVFDSAAVAAFDERKLFLLIHSGSRGFGDSILRRHVAEYKNGALDESSAAAAAYLRLHADALGWASANRKLIARRFASAIGAELSPCLDVHHNLLESKVLNGKNVWLHRKGAAPSDRGPVVIPGSRGALSYLVKATGEQSLNLATLAHGAGRKWKRADCKGRLEQRYSREDLQRTELGSRVICDDKDLLYEEAPEAYKNVDIVVNDLVAAGVIKLLLSFRPLITYKTRNLR